MKTMSRNTKKDERVTFRLAKADRELLLRVAKERERSTSWIVSKLVAKFLSDSKKDSSSSFNAPDLQSVGLAV